MNFILTPGVYAALNLLSKATRSKVLEAAFAFVICGIRPTNLSKNLLVMFMMVVDSASEGKLQYIPEEEKEENPVPAEGQQAEAVPEKPVKEKPKEGDNNLHIPINVDKENERLSGIKKVTQHHHRKRNRRK